jgi:hypothetical protein
MNRSMIASTPSSPHTTPPTLNTRPSSMSGVSRSSSICGYRLQLLARLNELDRAKDGRRDTPVDRDDDEMQFSFHVGVFSTHFGRVAA